MKYQKLVIQLCLIANWYIYIYIINNQPFTVIDSPKVTDGTFDHETPKKLKKVQNCSEHVSSKTPRTLRKRIAKG
jgi:hypothetical protein